MGEHEARAAQPDELELSSFYGVELCYNMLLSLVVLVSFLGWA